MLTRNLGKERELPGRLVLDRGIGEDSGSIQQPVATSAATSGWRVRLRHVRMRPCPRSATADPLCCCAGGVRRRVGGPWLRPTASRRSPLLLPPSFSKPRTTSEAEAHPRIWSISRLCAAGCGCACASLFFPGCAKYRGERAFGWAGL